MEKSVTQYIIGFLSSILLILASYSLVAYRFLLPFLTSWNIAIIIAGFALIQFIIQLYFFMDLRLKARSGWQLFVLIFMIFVVLILVIGSLWIMKSLNNRMGMTPDQVESYMQDQTGI